MASETTTMRTFVAHPVVPLSQKPHEKYRSPQGVMDTTTEYKEQYQGKWALPAQTIHPPITKKELGDFNPSTTHSRDFVPNPVPEINLCKVPNTYQPPKDTFDTVSTARTDFTDHGPVPLTPSLKPPPRPAISDEPFSDITAYRTDYTSPPMPHKFVHPRQVYVPSNKPFSSHTTNRLDFCKQPLTGRPECMKPQENKFYDESIPFESSTTNQQFYKTWDLPSRFSKLPAAYRPPTEKLSTDTTSKLEYPRYEYTTPPSSFKPVHKPNQIGPFDACTTKATDYKAWSNIGRPPLIIPGKKYEAPKNKFDGISTFQADYLGTHEPRPLPIKPRARHINTEKMESMTNYRDNYSGSGYKVCPAALLVAPGSGRDDLYSHEANGHQFYKHVQSKA